MPDNWTFVAAAYGLAALVFGGYWRRLGRKERELAAVRTEREAVRNDRASRSQQPSGPGHPRSEPGTRHPLQKNPLS
jgi:hypothetical protein